MYHRTDERSRDRYYNVILLLSSIYIIIHINEVGNDGILMVRGENRLKNHVGNDRMDQKKVNDSWGGQTAHLSTVSWPVAATR